MGRDAGPIEWGIDPALRERMARMGRDPGRLRATPSRIQSLRESRGLTQRRLALLVNVDPATIRKAERGYLAQLRITTVLRIANALECGAADLFPILAEQLAGKRKGR